MLYQSEVSFYFRSPPRHKCQDMSSTLFLTLIERDMAFAVSIAEETPRMLLHDRWGESSQERIVHPFIHN
jgi:hypothetical protein